MLRIKEGVDLFGVHAIMHLVMIVGEPIWYHHGQDLTITSGRDGVHGPKSLHPKGLALDLRANFWTPAEAEEVANKLRDALTSDFDVLLELKPDGSVSHIHTEYDPDSRGSQ